jgi:hypothetical protein
MIDVLESLNLTQESQSNAKEMSWDERRCFGSAQYAHKYVKCLRVWAKSWPPSIYRRTPSQRAVGQILWATDASVSHPTDVVPASIAHDRATCPRALNSQRSSSNRRMRPSLARPSVCRPNRRSSERVEDRPQADGCVCRDAVRRCPASVATYPTELLKRRPIDVDYVRLSLTHPYVCHLLTGSRG